MPVVAKSSRAASRTDISRVAIRGKWCMTRAHARVRFLPCLQRSTIGAASSQTNRKSSWGGLSSRPLRLFLGENQAHSAMRVHTQTQVTIAPQKHLGHVLHSLPTPYSLAKERPVLCLPMTASGFPVSLEVGCPVFGRVTMKKTSPGRVVVQGALAACETLDA